MNKTRFLLHCKIKINICEVKQVFDLNHTISIRVFSEFSSEILRDIIQYLYLLCPIPKYSLFESLIIFLHLFI